MTCSPSSSSPPTATASTSTPSSTQTYSGRSAAAGGNVGVITRLQYRLHKVDTILGGLLILPASPRILRSFITAAHNAPDDLSTIATLAPAPPLPIVAPKHHGQPALIVRLAYAGDPDASHHAIAPLRALATPLADTITPMRYQHMYAADAPDHPRVRIATRSMFLDDLDEHAESMILDRVQVRPSPISAVQIRVLGGALARVPADATAFAHRERRLMVTFASRYQNPAQAASHEAWVADSLETMRPATHGVPVGFLGDEGAARVHDAYPEPTHKRLAAIKRRYDPTNLFRLNQNIAPAGRSRR